MMADHIQYIGELKNIVASKSGKIINLMISGSDLFGFKSEDSDTDYRGCYQIVTNKLLTTKGLFRIQDNEKGYDDCRYG